MSKFHVRDEKDLIHIAKAARAVKVVIIKELFLCKVTYFLSEVWIQILNKITFWVAVARASSTSLRTFNFSLVVRPLFQCTKVKLMAVIIRHRASQIKQMWPFFPEFHTVKYLFGKVRTKVNFMLFLKNKSFLKLGQLIQEKVPFS